MFLTSGGRVRMQAILEGMLANRDDRQLFSRALYDRFERSGEGG
jgi:hypothetical protein